MPHRLYHWRVRIEAALGEYQAVRIALDMLGDATVEEIHELTDERDWEDLVAADIYAAERNLEATYLIRMYSVFERAIASYWRQLPGNQDRQVDGDVMLGEVGHVEMDEGVIASAQAVRAHRNKLVHRRIDDHAGDMTVKDASRLLLAYLESLPATWG